MPITSAPHLRHWFHARLRAAITSGELPVGARLRENDLAHRWKVSRTVVRESFRQLEVEQLITFEQSTRGAVVRDYSPAEASERTNIHHALSDLAARLFAERASTPQKNALRDAIAVIIDSLTVGNLPDYTVAVADFHVILRRGSGSDDLEEMLSRLDVQIALCSKCAVKDIHSEHIVRESDSVRRLASIALSTTRTD